MPNDTTRDGLAQTIPAMTQELPGSAGAQQSFAIVGIGASAGGLAAFSSFFAGMPSDKDPGMAFVLVQHLAPDHESILTELIQRNTRMQVFEVEDGMTVQINCAYIIPPNRDMAFLNGTLQLLEPTVARGYRLPIDYLFRSLAQDQRERAIGIVLSGTGSDGTLGLRAIKGEGGMVMAQTPESSAFDGMPLSAAATGLVDFTLAPADMPAQLIRYVNHAFGKPHRVISTSVPHSENALKKIFILLRTQTGHDFSQYKPSTICRRIERRMAVHQILSVDDYVKYLQQTPIEVEALFRDLLIGVTSFFRDVESFDALERQVIPRLFKGKQPGSAIRVWSSGCSTGEEAYSIAILLQEQIEKVKLNFSVQVFATDIDNRAIAIARAGVFPASIASDLSPERLARFFTAEPEGASYRVNKVIRDMLIFSEHNLIKNPPFSKLDLISCRNLLIYLGAELQKKLIAMFHYALNPGGTLFLGTSETTGDCGDQFAVLDRKHKLYQRNEDFQGAKRAALVRFLSPAGQTDGHAKAQGAAQGLSKQASGTKVSPRELTEQTLLAQVVPVAALVNGYGDILYLHGRTGMFLEPAPGDAGINNILKMAREGLRAELTVCLHRAAAAKARACVQNLRVKTNGHFTLVNLTICPVASGPVANSNPAGSLPAAEARQESPLYLVILEEAQSHDSKHARVGKNSSASDAPHRKDMSAQIADLNEELQAKDEFLHAANEELETSNEELKSSNEEMQSVNEELNTVNAELQSKVSDLSRANNDMNNLLAGTGIGTIFVDYALRILRFTPAATQMINLIAGDIGRPVGHIMSNLLGYETLVSDIQSVLRTLIPKEIDVQTKPLESSNAAQAGDSKYYTLRILPYRTLDNVIEGAVITFVEITEIVRAREASHASDALMRLAVVVRDAHDAILVQDLSGRITAWNPGAVRMYGWSEAEALAMNTAERIPADLREKALARVLQLSQAQILEPCLTHRIAKDGSVLEVSLTSTALGDGTGRMYAIATTERYVSARHELANQALRRRAEIILQEKSQRPTRSINELSDETAAIVSPDAMRQKIYELQVHQIELQMQNEELRRTQLELHASRARYFDLYDLAPVGYCTISVAGLVVEANLTAAVLFGVSRRDLIGKLINRFICKSDQDTFYLQRRTLMADGLPVSFDLCMQKANLEPIWVLVAAAVETLEDESVQLRLVLNDISARRASESIIQEHQARYRNLFVAIDEGFCIIELLFDDQQKAIDYRFIEVNPAFEKHTGLIAATGKRIRELSPDIEEFWLNLYGNVALTGVAIRIVHEAKSMGRWFEVHASLYSRLPKRSVAVIYNDITERKQSEIRSLQLDQVLQDKNASLELATAVAEKATLVAENASRDAELASQVAEKATLVAEKASHVAEKASQAKSAFLSSMSHELRTPLNAILGFAQMLEIGSPPPTPLQKRNVDQILKAGWYLLDLINEVLDLSMIESGKVMLSREPVALADLLLDCRAMIEPQAEKRGIHLHFPRLERGSFVSADRTRFKQVMLNLLLNAIKYNRPNGSVTIECGLTSPNILRIGVRDTGAGMAPEQMAHLFQPFNRLGKETGVEEGTGIGLVVTKRLVELMGGNIGVESTVDVGSLFWIELCVTSPPQFALLAQNAGLPFAPAGDESTDTAFDPDEKMRTLLYVEDNPANLELVEQLIAMRNDVRLIGATDGSVGIEFARNLQPDVILMDINLPGISGIQALQILRCDTSTKHIPVIALSANAMVSDIEQGIRLGFFNYLTKPIRVRDFMQTLDDALAFAHQSKPRKHHD